MIETDPRLTGDPLWLALDGLVYRLKADGSLVLRQYRWKHQEGFDGDTIAALAAQVSLGPVMEWDKDDERLTVYHPNHPRPLALRMGWVAMWMNGVSRHTLETLIEYVEAWKDTRKQQLVGSELASHRTGQGASNKEANSGALDSDSFLSCPDLARKHGKDKNALAKRLERWRPSNREHWREIEASERAPRDPQYLYREVAVKAIIDSMP